MAASLDVPTVHSHGVVLRAFVDSDADAVLEAATDPLIPLITTVPAVAELDLAVAYLGRQHLRARSGEGYSFAIGAGTTCVGQIGLWLRDLDRGRGTLGYWIRPSHRRQGHATAALRAITDWAWSSVPVDRLQLHVDPTNTGSWRAAERAGYEREGLLRSWMRVGDQRRDMFVYARVRPNAVE